MPVPIQRLIKEHKLDSDSLKKAFDLKTLEKRKETKQLVTNVSEIIRMGIERNRRDYRLYKAMDWAYDAPFYQVSYTQLRGLLSNKPDDKKVLETVNSWGLSHMLPDVLDKDGKPCACEGNPKLNKKALNLPVFFNIFVPIVMAYVSIRWAKLFNDRNLNPHFKYEPAQFTQANRARAEIMTQIVQRQSQWFDYPSDTKQSILQTLLYGFCINFPREAWFVERQEDEKGKEVIVREGLRFNMPHPSRMYYDQYHRLSSLNSNSGCEYAGYWEMCRYRDIHDNPLYWNKDAISIGATNWFDLRSSDFLSQVCPCTFDMPALDAGMGSGGAGALDRQSAAARSYTQSDFDKATLKTEHFQRLIPSEYGLGDYKHPVWFRLVMASDNAVVWAEPLGFDVLPTYSYDADFNRSRFRSLALEIIPFQDHISNLMTQWILAVKENLTNPVFYDKEKIPESYVRQLENMGQKLLNGRVFVPFSSTENYRFRQDQREAFSAPVMAHHPTGELATLVSGVLNMLDRIMQLSPQEIGQAAQHEQTAEETRVIASNTGTRVIFTGTGIDSGDYAKKKMLYDATMSYADDEITVGITTSFTSTEEELKKLLGAIGFSLNDESAYDPQSPDSMRAVKGQKSALRMEFFAGTRDKNDRVNLPAIADAMSKIFSAIAGNPVLIQALGPIQLVELLNQIIQTSGVPQEFRLKGIPTPTGANPEEQTAQVAETLKKFAEQVQQLVAQKQQETMAASAQQTTQIVGQAMQEAKAQSEQMAGQTAQAVGPALEQAQQVAQASAQQLAEHEQVITAQQQQIQQLNQAVAQLTMAVQAAQAKQQPELMGV